MNTEKLKRLSKDLDQSIEKTISDCREELEYFKEYIPSKEEKISLSEENYFFQLFNTARKFKSFCYMIGFDDLYEKGKLLEIATKAQNKDSINEINKYAQEVVLAFSKLEKFL